MSETPLTPPQVEGLQGTQRSFAAYQEKAFPPRSPEFFALELCGECGELANLEKKIWRDPGRRDDCRKELPHEAADVFIALMNYCNARGIDLQQSVVAKLQVIEKRRTQGKMGSGSAH